MISHNLFEHLILYMNVSFRLLFSTCVFFIWILNYFSLRMKRHVASNRSSAICLISRTWRVELFRNVAYTQSWTWNVYVIIYVSCWQNVVECTSKREEMDVSVKHFRHCKWFCWKSGKKVHEIMEMVTLARCENVLPYETITKQFARLCAKIFAFVGMKAPER